MRHRPRGGGRERSRPGGGGDSRPAALKLTEHELIDATIRESSARRDTRGATLFHLAREITIGDRPVGPGHPCYVIAEAGSNHNGSLELAERLVAAAAEAGCDAVKFQVFEAPTLMVESGPRAAYLGDVMDDGQSLFDLFRSTAIDRTWLPYLAQRCREKAIHFLATPFDHAAVDVLTAPDVDVPAIKNASSELWDIPLIHKEAASGRPLLISTGMAALPDVEAALRAAQQAGAEKTALLHCTVSYPTDAADVNLRAMGTLRDRFGVPVGLSDHTAGIWAPLAAVALGADILEKHLTLDRAMPGPDHPFAVEPDELALMVRQIRQVEQALGDGAKLRRPVEEEIYSIGRRNVVARRKLDKGSVITAADLTVLRGPLGIAPKDIDSVLGRKVRHNVTAGETLQWKDLW